MALIYWKLTAERGGKREHARFFFYTVPAASRMLLCPENQMFYFQLHFMLSIKLSVPKMMPNPSLELSLKPSVAARLCRNLHLTYAALTLTDGCLDSPRTRLGNPKLKMKLWKCKFRSRTRVERRY